MINIAKRITLFFVVLIMLVVNGTYVYAIGSETTTEIQTTQNQEAEEQTKINVVKLDVLYNTIKTTVKDYTIMIENQSSKKIRGLRVIVLIDKERLTIRNRNTINGFESYSINLKDYYTQDFIEGKEISIYVENCMTRLELAIYIIIWIGLMISMIWLCYKDGYDGGVFLCFLISLFMFLIGTLFGF